MFLLREWASHGHALRITEHSERLSHLPAVRFHGRRSSSMAWSSSSCDVQQRRIRKRGANIQRPAAVHRVVQYLASQPKFNLRCWLQEKWWTETCCPGTEPA